MQGLGKADNLIATAQIQIPRGHGGGNVQLFEERFAVAPVVTGNGRDGTPENLFVIGFQTPRALGVDQPACRRQDRFTNVIDMDMVWGQHLMAFCPVRIGQFDLIDAAFGTFFKAQLGLGNRAASG